MDLNLKFVYIWSLSQHFVFQHVVAVLLPNSMAQYSALHCLVTATLVHNLKMNILSLSPEREGRVLVLALVKEIRVGRRASSGTGD